MKTETEIAADKAEIAKQAKIEAANMLRARSSAAIKAIVARVLKRDKRISRNSRESYLDGDNIEVSTDQFARDIINSDIWDKPAGIIGSGVETAYDQHGIRGTVGECVIQSEEFKRVVEGNKIVRGGTNKRFRDIPG